MSSPDPSHPALAERRAYQRRRLVDAARGVPLIGALLWWIPLLWAIPQEAPSGSKALIYIFAVWSGLIFSTWALVYALRRPDGRSEDEADE